MNRVSRFQMPSGDTMVVLPQSDYQAMLDALEMQRMWQPMTVSRASALCGNEELVPSGVVDRLLKGETGPRLAGISRNDGQGSRCVLRDCNLLSQ